MNKVIIIGNLTKDPDVKTLENNSHVATFTVAVNGIKEGDLNFIPCKAFGKIAEAIDKFLKKGNKCAVEGYLSIYKYTSNNETRYGSEVICNNVEFLTPKK